MSVELRDLAPAGYYLALRLGFAFPTDEVNCLPRDWVRHYARNSYVMRDPVVRWAYANTGWVRWSDLTPDAQEIEVLNKARDFKLIFGTVISIAARERSFGMFARSDREFTTAEIDRLHRLVQMMHRRSAPPANITAAETEALGMVRDGLRLKQIAYELGVSEGAVKQRLKSAKVKLGAATSAQAASMASTFGLI